MFESCACVQPPIEFEEVARVPVTSRHAYPLLRKGTNVTQWCDGLKAVAGTATSRQKRQLQAHSDSDLDSSDEDNPLSKKKGKEDRVQKIVDQLKKEHGEKYTCGHWVPKLLLVG